MTSAAESTSETKAEFQHLLNEWGKAIVANDADQIDAFIEPDWLLITPEGGPLPRERFLKIVREGALTHAAMAFDVRSAQIYDGTAVVVAHGTNHGEWQGEAFSADEWVTEVFVRRGDRWRCALSALTPIVGEGR